MFNISIQYGERGEGREKKEERREQEEGSKRRRRRKGEEAELLILCRAQLFQATSRTT